MVLMLMRWSWRRFLEELPTLSRGLSHLKSRDSAQCLDVPSAPAIERASFFSPSLSNTSQLHGGDVLRYLPCLALIPRLQSLSEHCSGLLTN
jgi:hypothetical protein